MPDTASVPGFRAHIYLSSDNVTFNRLGEIIDATVNLSREQLGANNHQSMFNQVVPGKITWGVTGRMNYLPDDTAQDLVRSVILNSSAMPTYLYVKFMSLEVVGKPKLSGRAMVATASIVANEGSVTTSDIEFAGAGDLTEGNIVSGDILP